MATGPRSETMAGTVARLHPDRAAGGDRDHRDPDRAVAPGGAGGARGGAADPVHQQPEAARAGGGRLRVDQRLPAARLPAAQLAARRVRAGSGLQRVRPPAPGAGAAGDLQRHQLQPDLLRRAEQHARRDRHRDALVPERLRRRDAHLGLGRERPGSGAPAIRPSRARGSGTSSSSSPARSTSSSPARPSGSPSSG